MLWRMPADARRARIGIMSIHIDGSMGGGIGAWPEIDIRPLQNAPGVDTTQIPLLR
jgi:hypothetical protein